jgi:amidase
MSKIAFESATELTRAIRDKRIGSAELLELYIERYERFNPVINAIIATDLEAARKRAREADEATVKGENWGPLHGLPMTIKDTMEVAGMPCTWGTPLLKSFVPHRNAATVQSLIEAGAVIFGKTNVPLFGLDFQSFNEVYGQTNNPWNLNRTPGGSSGGAAAALAAGLTGLEIGSDIGGSIRAPAHYCGVYGHKSTFGIISPLGQAPPLLREFMGDYTTETDLVVSGPLARSADDLDLVMRLIVKPPMFQRKAINIQLPPPRKKTLKDHKIGVWLDDTAYPVDAGVGDCLQQAVDRLIDAGASATDKHPDISFVDSDRVYQDLLGLATVMAIPPENFERMKERAATSSPDDKSNYAILARRVTSTHRYWQELNYQRTILRQKWADYFEDVDVLLCPVTRVPAFPHDHTEIEKRVLQISKRDEPCLDALLPWVGLATVAYLPATVAPVGLTKDKLPVGIQIIGPYLEDHTPLHVAKLMEDVTGGFTPPSGFSQ